MGDVGKVIWNDSVGRLGNLGCGTLWDIKVLPQSVAGGLHLGSSWVQLCFRLAQLKLNFKVLV